jgi:hypothetical protein
MSSRISTDAQTLVSEPGGGKTTRKDSGFQAWQLFTLAGLISASVIALYARSRPSSVRVALILTVFGAAVIGVAALRALAPLAGGWAGTESSLIGGRTRAALEREKALALRSIKELEFDHAMKKVSDKDFADMSSRLRARATRIMRELDASVGYRDDIEREIARRLGTMPAASMPASKSAGRSDDVGDATPTDREMTAPSAQLAAACATCGTGNDADARFCKACGSRIAPA